MMSKSPQDKRGGKRPGAGRPKGVRNQHRRPEDDLTVTRSISMPRRIWDRIDAMRGDQSRGKWLAGDPRLSEPGSRPSMGR